MTKRLSRTKVVAHAAVLADEIGFDSLTITKLGRSLGIAPPGVYRHVADLTDLQHAISQLASQEAGNMLSLACAGLSEVAALTALAHAMRDWASKHPGRYAAMQIAPLADDVEGQAAVKPILTVITSVLRAYNLDTENLIDATRFLRSTMHGFISLEANGGFQQPRSVEATFDAIITSMNATLTHWDG